MNMFRVFAVVLLACAPAAGAFAAAPAEQPARDLLAPAPLPLGLKVCLVGAALGAAVERLRSGSNARKS